MRWMYYLVIKILEIIYLSLHYNIYYNKIPENFKIIIFRIKSLLIYKNDRIINIQVILNINTYLEINLNILK